MSLKRSVTYIVLILCFSFTKGFSQIPITFNIGSDSGPMGSTRCIDFTVEDFIKVSSSQFVVRFDPTVVSLICPPDLTNSCFNEGGSNGLSTANFNCQDITNGFLNFIWFDLNTTGITLDNCNLIFTLCFDLIGDPCDMTDITIAESTGIPFEFIATDCITGEENDFPPIINSGEITIDPAGYMVTTAFCSTDDSSNSGSITFSGSGGTGPYSWSVSNTSASGSGLQDCETASVENLGPGTYTVTLIDANGVSRSDIVVISTNSDFPFVLTLDGTNPTCFDRQNGRIDVVNIEGGASPFIYEWSTFEFEEDSLKLLGAGNYDLTITDVNGCTASSSISLNVDTIKISFDLISDPSCDGSSNGVVSLTAEGGTPFNTDDYEWEIDGTGSTIYFGESFIPTNPFSPANLPSGCFEVTATDNASIACTSDPIEFCLEAGSFSELVIDTTNVSCFGTCDGAVVITAGDMGNFSFLVTDQDGIGVVGMNTQVAFDTQNVLCPGTYSVTVNDIVAGCSIDTFFVITEPDLLELNVLDSLGPGCGGGDGMISFETLGGTEDLVYEWNDAFDQPSRMNMGGGDYSITVTDANGCQDSLSFTFGDGGDLGLNAIVCNAVSCGGAMDGSICASVTSAGVFTYSWEDASGMSLGDGEQIDGVGGGVYFVTATDGDCTATDSVLVAPGETPSVTVDQTDPLCPDGDGNLTVNLATGTNPATFTWTLPSSTDVLSIGAVFTGTVGEYNLNILDAQGCEVDTLLELTPPDNIIEIDITNFVSNTCFGQCEGGATFSASGGPNGSGNYIFFISEVDSPINPNGNEVTINTLCGGENWVYAVDGTCSSDTIWFTVPDAEPIALNETTSILNPPSCFGGDDGNITIDVEGGDNSSYDILWINEGVTGPTITDLTAGLYIYSVTDGSNCVFIDSIMLEVPEPLLLSINTLTTKDVRCIGDSDGRIGLLTSGGNSGSLTYDWDPVVSNTDFAENLPVGLYSVTVTDSKGCTAETSYEFFASEPILPVINTPEEPDCFGGVTCLGVEDATGGVGDDFTFTINNGPRIELDTCINVFAGPYLLTVFDSVGCSVDTTITIGQPEEIIVDFVEPEIMIDLGDDSGPVSVSIVSELDIDSIFWDPLTDLECNTLDCQVVTFNPSGNTTYTITVIDENGCLVTGQIDVIVDLTRNVYFPNIFSPNGDNENDFFQLATGSGVREITYFRMFDRWGNMVHEELGYMPDDSLHPGWDGTFNNRNVESGVFVYFAEVLFDDDVRVLYKGDVTLVR